MIRIPPLIIRRLLPDRAIAFELNEQLNDVDYIFSGLSGGGFAWWHRSGDETPCSTNPYRRRELAQERGDVGKPEADKPVMVEGSPATQIRWAAALAWITAGRCRL